MNCKGLIVELSSYLDGEMDAASMAELQSHLERCTKCKVLVDTTRQTIEIYCGAEAAPLPDNFRERLHEALLRRLGRKPSA